MMKKYMDKLQAQADGFTCFIDTFDNRVFVGAVVVEVTSEGYGVYMNTWDEYPTYETKQLKRLVDKVNKINE